MMNLQHYLNRIGYDGPTTPTLDVLKAVHRCHACTIPYENVDVQLQRPVTQDAADIFQKIVGQGRGGWCYEMNGLLGWALAELGFNVERMCGGVGRQFFGDDAFGNHLVLLIDLEGTRWIADVGLGDGILEPLEFRESEQHQYGRTFRLEQLDDNEWRFHNRQDGSPPSFDFYRGGDTEDKLTATCAKLQEDPESMFRQNLICQRMTEDGGWMLLGRVLRSFDPAAPRTLLNSESELAGTLENTFGLKLPPIDGLWQKVLTRHAELFGDTPVDEIRFGPPDPD